MEKNIIQERVRAVKKVHILLVMQFIFSIAWLFDRTKNFGQL